MLHYCVRLSVCRRLYGMYCIQTLNLCGYKRFCRPEHMGDDVVSDILIPVRLFSEAGDDTAIRMNEYLLFHPVAVTSRRLSNVALPRILVYTRCIQIFSALLILFLMLTSPLKLQVIPFAIHSTCPNHHRRRLSSVAAFPPGFS